MSARQTFESRHTFGNRLEALLVTRKNRDLWRAKNTWIIQRANLEDNRIWHVGRSGQQMSATICAELPRHRIVQIISTETLGCTLSKGHAGGRHGHKYIGGTAGDVLTFTAVTLGFHQRLARSFVTHLAAIAASGDIHSDGLIEETCGVRLLEFLLGIHIPS